MIQKIDSIEIYLEQIKIQSEVLGKVLSGDELSMDVENNSSPKEVQAPDVSLKEPSKKNIQRSTKTTNYSFFIPVSGVISDSFNIQRNHLGIDIVAKSKEVIKAIQNGSVVFSGWTSKGGHTMIIQHSNNFFEY